MRRINLDAMDDEQIREAARMLELENERLFREVIEQRRKLAELLGDKERQKLLFELADLERQLKDRNKRLFGRSSEKREKAEKRANREPQTGHGPREQKLLGVVEREHDLDVADQVCTQCGGELTEFEGQFEESHEIDSLRRQFVIVRHKRKKYRCKCGGCIETAPAPDKLIPGGRYSIDFAVDVAVSKYADHLPLERQVKIMRREGLETDSQTLWDQLHALAKHVEPLHALLREHQLSQPVVGVDETTWRVLGSKGTASKRWQTWALVTANAAYYDIQDSRSAGAAKNVLGDYAGSVLCDGYSAYTALKKQGGAFTLAHCWAHVRRKFIECEELGDTRATAVIELIGELYAAERECETVDERRTIRQQRSADIVKRIEAWALDQRALPQSPLGKAIAYMGNLWPGLLRFLENPGLALDNNATERALRGVVLGRKNHLGSKSQRGTEVAALFYSLIETAKLQGLDPHAYLASQALAAVRGEELRLPHQVG